VDKIFPSWCGYSFTVQLHLFTCVPGTAKNSSPRFIGWYVYSGLASPNVFFPKQTQVLWVHEVCVAAVLPSGFCSLTCTSAFLPSVPLPSYKLETKDKSRTCTAADKSPHCSLRAR